MLITPLEITLIVLLDRGRTEFRTLVQPDVSASATQEFRSRRSAITDSTTAGMVARVAAMKMRHKVERLRYKPSRYGADWLDDLGENLTGACVSLAV
ncbi:hypothetical protein HDU89_003855 [Geranomyces variabilis]|nr:hypothetical protein HDU89_003855 [Geranomyces variabilis]